jgi:hypothetical protein
MKKALAVSNILSWVNLIISGVIVLCALLTFLVHPALPVLFVVILMGSVGLHSYAALQLRKSILNPSLPLSRQTPTGIRLMGYMSLFFAIMSFSNGIYMFQETKKLVDQIQVPEQMKNFNMIAFVHGIAAFMLVFSLSIIMNVILNIRLLKWYMMAQQANKEN